MKKTTKKTKLNPAYTLFIDLTNNEDLRKDIVTMKTVYDLPFDAHDLVTLIIATKRGVIEQLFDGNNAIIKKDDNTFVSGTAIWRTKKEPWYKKLWKKLTGKGKSK